MGWPRQGRGGKAHDLPTRLAEVPSITTSTLAYRSEISYAQLTFQKGVRKSKRLHMITPPAEKNKNKTNKVTSCVSQKGNPRNRQDRRESSTRLLDLQRGWDSWLISMLENSWLTSCYHWCKEDKNYCLYNHVHMSPFCNTLGMLRLRYSTNIRSGCRFSEMRDSLWQHRYFFPFFLFGRRVCTSPPTFVFSWTHDCPNLYCSGEYGVLEEYGCGSVGEE